jgi:hypothetical protein
MKRLLYSAVLVAFALMAAASRSGADCSSPTGCLDCQTSGSGFKCAWQTSSAYCDCEVFVFGGTTACGVDGACTYQPSGGGGGGGGTGGGDGNCLRLPGQWCPAECASCGTIYF